MSQQFSGGANRPNHHKKNHRGNLKVRKNERIRVPKVRVIGPDGGQIGVIPTHEALQIAKKLHLDLVEVSPTARPPVCRILDFGKFMYDESKKQKRTQKTASTKLKETKFRLNIDEHDYITKVRRAESFLAKGYKVKVTLMLRGREMESKARAFDVVNRVIRDLKLIATADSPPKLAGKNISATLSPLPEKNRILKFNESIEEDEDPSPPTPNTSKE